MASTTPPRSKAGHNDVNRELEEEEDLPGPERRLEVHILLVLIIDNASGRTYVVDIYSQ